MFIDPDFRPERQKNSKWRPRFVVDFHYETIRAAFGIRPCSHKRDSECAEPTSRARYAIDLHVLWINSITSIESTELGQCSI